MQIYDAPLTSPGYNMILHVMHAVPGMSAPGLAWAFIMGMAMQMLAMVVSPENLYRCLLLKTMLLCLCHFNLCTLSGARPVS